MIVLGISDSHEAHACIVRDGELLAVVAEERLSRLKADMGYPRQSVHKVLELSGVKPAEIDYVAFAGQKGSALQIINKINALFSVQDWVAQHHKYWGPKLVDGADLSPIDDFDLFKHLRGSDLENDPYYEFVEKARVEDVSRYPAIFNDLRSKTVCNDLGITPDKVRFYRHEDCHKAYGYHSSPFAGQDAIILTAEGGGDDSSATVSTFTSQGMTEHWKSNAVQLGRVYRFVTLILGMLPGQHEYKVMGLAPYGTEYHGKRSLEFLRHIHKVEGPAIIDTKKVADLYFSVRDALEGERFDGIAWALQTWVEEVLCQWVSNCIEEYKISNIVLSGGVAQNIKACKAIAAMADVSSLWAGPISGDGSLGIGAAWMATEDIDPQLKPGGIPTIYLGTGAPQKQIDKAIDGNQCADEFYIVSNPTPEDVARWLDEGCVIGRYSGRMEFGQRALGNRSILADPRDPKTVERINQKIKYRDFWMPFTPSMLAEEADRILVNPKKIFSPFMTVAFDLAPSFRDMLPAVVHPADETVRPQMLKREANPAYYDIISAFKDRTGLGVVLNTSFNLHGEPIVESPEDAISTFKRSDIDILLFDHVAVLRKERNRGN